MPQDEQRFEATFSFFLSSKRFAAPSAASAAATIKY
jgi:hypothetical protein